MKRANKIVLTAAVLVALSGLAYSENIGTSSTSEPVDSVTTYGTSMGSSVENSPAGDAARTVIDMDKEAVPGMGGDLERNNYPAGSPGGMMGRYSSAIKGGGMMAPDSGHGEQMP